MATAHTPRNTKQTLRNEARKLFAQRGYQAVSMRDIAQAVGVQQSAIYNHFASKQGLLVDLMVIHMERMLAGLKEALEEIEGPAERLEAFTRHHVLAHFDYLDEIFLAYMELRSLEEPGRSRVIALRKEYEGILRDILTEGAASGRFRVVDPGMGMRSILAMLTGISVWFREDGKMSRSEVAEAYVQSTMQMVGLEYELA